MSKVTPCALSVESTSGGVTRTVPCSLWSLTRSGSGQKSYSANRLHFARRQGENGPFFLAFFLGGGGGGGAENYFQRSKPKPVGHALIAVGSDTERARSGGLRGWRSGQGCLVCTEIPTLDLCDQRWGTADAEI